MHLYLHRSVSLLAVAAGHRVSCPATEGDVARARKLTAGNAGLSFVSCFLPRGRSLGTNAMMEVFR